MRFFIMVVLSYSLSAYALKKGAYEEMPGANNIEREIRWAWKMLPDFLKQCRYSSDCGFTPEQKELVRRISLQLQGYNHDSLVFVSERDGKFTSSSGETERVALTGADPSSAILLNTDRYSTQGRSLGIDFWMGLLAHEMVHHLGIGDDTLRVPDLFGAAVRAGAQKLLTQTGFPEGNPEISLTILNPPIPENSGALEDFPEGELFHAMLMDRNTVLDQAGVPSLKKTMQFCAGKRLIKITATPDSSRLLENGPGKSILKTVFNGQIGCLDETTGQSWGDEVFFMNLVGLIQDGGGYFIDIKSEMNWGEAVDSEGAGAFERATILNSTIPTDVNAGKTLSVDARLQWTDRYEVIGCSALMTSPEWPADKMAQSTLFEPDLCTLKSLGGGVYDIHFEYALDPGTPDMKLVLQDFCLIVKTDGSDCIPGVPLHETLITVHQLAPTLPLTIADVHLERVEVAKTGPAAFEYPTGGTFDLVFLLKNARSVVSINMALNFDEADGTPLALLIPVVFNGDTSDTAKNEVMLGIQFVPQGADLSVRVKLNLPKEVRAMHPAVGQIASLYVISKELKYFQVDLLPLNLSFKQKD